MITQKTYMFLIEKGFKPKRVKDGTMTMDFSYRGGKLFWHLTFQDHENFVCKFPQDRAIKILNGSMKHNAMNNNNTVCSNKEVSK